MLVDKKETFIVDFFAIWCNLCKIIEPYIDKLADKFSKKLKVFRIDVDNHPDIITQFEVISIPTVIFFKDGEPFHRIVGLCEIEELEEAAKKLL